MTVRGNVTKRTVDALKPGAVLWDTEVSGFGCRCRSGGRKTYVIKYRLGGRQYLYTIGVHGSPWTPEKARQRALSLAGKVADGDNPAEERKGGRAVPTVKQLAERFLAEHAEVKTKARTAKDTRRLFDRFIMPRLGQVRVDVLARTDVARLHHDLRTTPYQANRVLAGISKMMNWAERHGLRPDGTNPCRHVERFKERPRERFLSEAELARLGDTLTEAAEEWAAHQSASAEARAEGREPPTRDRRLILPAATAAVRLLIFTGARMSEVLSLRWSEVDFPEGVLRLTDSKTGPKTIYLNPPALAVLNAQPCVAGNPYVLPGGKEGQHLADLEAPWQLIRARADLDDVRLHDLRHSFASVAAGLGQSLVVIGRLLGQSQAQTTLRYANLAADPVRQAANAIGTRLADAMRPRAEGLPRAGGR